MSKNTFFKKFKKRHKLGGAGRRSLEKVKGWAAYPGMQAQTQMEGIVHGFGVAGAKLPYGFASGRFGEGCPPSGCGVYGQSVHLGAVGLEGARAPSAGWPSTRACGLCSQEEWRWD